MHFSIDRTVHTTAFDKPVVDHWLERKIAQTAAGSVLTDSSETETKRSLKRDRSQGIAFEAGAALIDAVPNWEQFRLARVPSQLALKSVKLGAGPNWEQLVQLV